MSFFWLVLFLSLLEKDSILEKAESDGFFYKNADISETSECTESKESVCVLHNGKKYFVKRSGIFSADAKIANKSLHLSINPDNSYISYFLYIQTKNAVHKVKITKKELILEENPENILRLQIVGTGAGGPEILWSRKFKETAMPKFTGNFDKSLNSLRKFLKIKPLVSDPSLQKAAFSSLEKVKNEGLKHYSSKDGGIRHSGVHKKILGENLFTAKSEAEAWKMLVSSPSHLYNLINPQFRHYFYAIEKGKDEVTGAIVFSE